MVSEMNNLIKNNNTLIIFLVTIILLVLSYEIPEGELAEGIPIKNIDMFGDIRSDIENEDFQFDEYYEEDSGDSLNSLNGSYNQNSNNSFSPKTNYAALIRLNEIISSAENFVENEMGKIENYSANRDISTTDENITGNVGQLRSFISALSKASTRQVRIAHFGDSGIEGDLISSDLREMLQSKFGGKGLGFLPIITADINYRTSADFDYSKDWDVFGVNKRNPDRLPVGINGEVFVNKTNSWFQYEPKSRYRHSRNFDEVRLFYSDAKPSAINYYLDGTKKSERLSAGKEIQELKFSGKEIKSIKVELPQDKQAYFYGLSLESGPGVYVDNFPFRGNTGVDLKDIPVSTLKAFDKYLKYDLIIFQFGLNALSARNFDKYEKDMIKVVEHYQEAFPNASFILIGSQDRSVKRGANFETDPSLLKLVQAQINIARETKIAFWNLFDAMGGKNSMSKWVEANPPLAYKDYIHFNEYGVKKVAELFGEALMNVK